MSYIGHNSTTEYTLIANTSNYSVGELTVAGTILLDNTGKVGIGTTSPDRLLDVSGTGNVYGKFQSTNATGAGIELKDSGEDWLIQADDGVGAGGLAFYDLARTAYRVMFDANGYVGIGTTSPEARLEVLGNSDSVTAFKIGANATHGWHFYDSSTNGDLHIKSEASGTQTEVIRFTRANQRVGIGTTSPAAKLHVEGTGKFVTGTDTNGFIISENANNDQAIMMGVSGGSGSGSAYIKAASGSANESLDLIFQTANGGAEGTALTLRADNSADFNGKVGIGTTSPTAGLHVFKEGSNYTNGAYLLVESTNSSMGGGATFVGFKHAAAIGGNWKPLKIQAAGTVIMQLGSSGQLGVGESSIPHGNRSPLYHFIHDPDTGMDWIAADTLAFKTAGTERLRITSAGNVGIGTTSPDRLLDVSGTGAVYGKFQSTNGTGAGIELKAGGEDWLIQADDGVGNSGLAFYDLARTAYRVMFDANGRVGIGTNSPSSDLTFGAASGGIHFTDSSKGIYYDANELALYTTGADDFITLNAETYTKFAVNSSEKMRLTGDMLLIGKSTTTITSNGMQANLQVMGNSYNSSAISAMRWGANANGPGINLGKSRHASVGSNAAVQNADSLGNIYFSGDDGTDYQTLAGRISCVVNGTVGTGDIPADLVFSTGDGGSVTEAMRLAGTGLDATFAGDIIVGDTSSGSELKILSSDAAYSSIRFGSASDANACLLQTSLNQNKFEMITQNVGHTVRLAADNNVTNLTLAGASGSETATFVGALSKGSGSFKIDHPLPAKKDTHHLVHSFIEGPQADLIYRGKVVLSSGTATVNIDTSASMTSGTFEALCTDVQCFTSNETGWTAVKGSVSGATLTIQAQDNSCTDTISWMVVGERKDKHMIDTDWTDSNGKVIVEPMKPEDDTP